MTEHMMVSGKISIILTLPEEFDKHMKPVIDIF